MVTSHTNTSNSKTLLDAGTLDGIAGQATRTCESCGVEKVPVGPCFIRDQALSGFSNPNSRICLYAARRPLNADVYPPYDQSTRHALEEQLLFVPRSDNEHATEYEKTLKNIRLTEDQVENVSKAFEESQVVVLKAPTGYGKSTKLPYWLCWHEKSKFSKSSGKVIVTEPKRLAAEGVARTVSRAHQFQVPAPGLDVGLQHGGVSSSGESNKLLFITDGSLINRLIKRELDDVQLIVVDEAHERNERIELILLVLRFLLPQYPHLKLLILSATIDPKNFTTYFQPEKQSDSGSTCGEAPFVSIKAKEIKWEEEGSYVVTEEWLGPFKPKFDATSLGEIVRTACDQAKLERGHVLVFLPGEVEIDELHEKIKDPEGFQIERLLGKTSQEERQKIQNFSASEGLLIILATNVAESSVTFTDLACVVDCGLSKRSKNDDLKTEKITKAEQRQRRGRVGRNRTGWYYAAFSENDLNGFKEYPDSSLVDLSDYHREVMLLQAMSVGIAPEMLEMPQSYLMAPEELKEPTNRVLERIRKRGGLAGEPTEEYLTPIGLLAAQAGVSVELAQLLLIGDHHNVLTEMSAVVASMSWRREHKQLAGVDKTDLFPDHVDDKSVDNDSSLPDEPDGDSIDDEDSDADDHWARRNVTGELRDSYLLQSFDKQEEDEFGHTAALMAEQGLEEAKGNAFLRLEKTNRIQQQFQERVPEDRLREIDPRLFDRVQLAVNCWRTNGWRFELSLFADANLIAKGSKEGQVDTATKREKNLQTLWELEGRLVRSHGSKADRIILKFVRNLREEGKEHRVVSDDKYRYEYKNDFSDLEESDHERRSENRDILCQLEEFLLAQDSQHSLAKPLEIIVDASNICRNRDVLKEPLDPAHNADINQIVELMDDLAFVAASTNQSHHGPRNSLISNLGRHRNCIDGEIDVNTRAELIPELTMPVGSRWKRESRESKTCIRNPDSEKRFIEALSQGHSLLSRIEDNLTDEGAKVDVDILRNVDLDDLEDKCFFADVLKKQYLTTPAKEAQGVRKRHEGQPIEAQSDRGNYFRARRAPNSKVELIPSYLESEVIAEMKKESRSDIEFIIYRDHDKEHYVSGGNGEVKSVKVSVKTSADFHAVVELGAWQVCPWFNAVPDQKEYGALSKQGEEKGSHHSKMPAELEKFGEHKMKIVSLGGLERLLCTTYDLSEERETFVKQMQVVKGESVEFQRTRIAKAATKFKMLHWQMWKKLSQPPWVWDELKLDPQKRSRFEVQIQKDPETHSADGRTWIKFEAKATDNERKSTRLYLSIWLDEGIDPQPAIKKVKELGKINVWMHELWRGECQVRAEDGQLKDLGLVSKRDKKKEQPEKQRQAKESSVTPARSTVSAPSQPPSAAVRLGRSTARASRARSSSPSRAKKSLRGWIWLALIGVGIIALWMQSFITREPTPNDMSGSPESEAIVTTFSPATPNDWFDALNCVEDPSERTVGSAATVIFVCYSESNPERHSLSLFQYDSPPDQLEINRRVQRACTKRGPTGEVFALFWPGQPAFFIYTIYADAVAQSRASNLFERLSC